jgi:hypothetical protein
MGNSFYKRNFDGHLDCGRMDRRLNNSPEHVAFSNSLYDRNKGITHTFLHTSKGEKDDIVRLVCDVEIAMSQDPSITSEFSSMYQRNIAERLVRPASLSSPALSDDELLKSVPSNVGLERDEISRLSRNQLEIAVIESKRFQEASKDNSSETTPADNSFTPPADS